VTRVTIFFGKAADWQNKLGAKKLGAQIQIGAGVWRFPFFVRFAARGASRESKSAL
jgi:hypothetical protein